MAFLALAVFCAFSGCGRECSEPLLMQFSRSEFAPETWLIDLGLPDFRTHLVAGWSGDEWWGGQQFSFVWGIGSSSVIRLNRYGTADVRLRFRCAPNEPPDKGGQTIATILNGVPIATTQLRPGFAIYELAVPASRLRAGENIVEFRYRYSGRPVFAGTTDARPLAVAWDWIEILERGAKPNMRTARKEKDGIVMPYRSALRFPLDLEPDGTLKIDAAEVEGAIDSKDRGRMTMTLRSSDGRLLANGGAAVDARPVRLALPLKARTSAVLELMLLEPRGGTPSATGVMLRNPRIVRHCR
jgi:hypothetical protein